MSGELSLTLDHVALVTPDLAASKKDYEKLGFRLTAESSHRGKVTPDGPEELWGTGNHCAMFHRGYYEILGITDENRYHEHFAAHADFHGVSLIALGCGSAERLYESYGDRISGLREPIEVGRDVPFGDGTRPGLFRIVHLEEQIFPEAELFFIEHATKDALWQDELLEHPNGVTSLAGITLCSEDPEATASRFERVTFREPTRSDGRARFELTQGVIEVAGPDEIAARYPEAVLPAVPCVAVVKLTVKKLAETKRFLKKNDITPHALDGGLWVRPERAGGVILEFLPE